MGKFDLGQVVVTKGISERLDEDKKFKNFVQKSLGRYSKCDWGDLCKEDKHENDEAVKNGDLRIHASYIYKASNENIWIITEADRSYTTILFPMEY